MNEDYIKQRISRIRELIRQTEYPAAFQDLRQFIVEMDGQEVEDEEEREFLDQLIMLESRYNNFIKAKIEGVQADQQEINQITKSFLLLTNEVSKVDPSKFVPDPNRVEPKTEKEDTEIVAHMSTKSDISETRPITDFTNKGQAAAAENLSENKGWSFAIDKRDDNVNVQMKGIPFAKIFRGLIFLMALLAVLLFYFKGCSGCGAIKPPPITDATGQDSTEIKDPNKEPPLAKVAVCPEAATYNFEKSTSGKTIASYLSDPESKYPKRFKINDIQFESNSVRLNTKTKRALDDIVVCLKGCENTTLDIYALLLEKEDPAYRGSKEVSLDDVRAKSVYDYMKSRGLDESRINYEGDGLSSGTEQIEIEIRKSK